MCFRTVYTQLAGLDLQKHIRYRVLDNLSGLVGFYFGFFHLVVSKSGSWQDSRLVSHSATTEYMKKTGNFSSLNESDINKIMDLSLLHGSDIQDKIVFCLIQSVLSCTYHWNCTVMNRFFEK